MYERIICDPEILGGKPVIKETRISVEMILEWMASGATAPEIVAEYDQLTLEDIQQALQYAAASIQGNVVLQVKIAS